MTCVAMCTESPRAFPRAGRKSLQAALAVLSEGSRLRLAPAIEWFEDTSDRAAAGIHVDALSDSAYAPSSSAD